jgi:hypothetical protein
LEIFADTVVPILRARGLFRTEYTGRTLRDHFGLPRPPGRSASAVSVPAANVPAARAAAADAPAVNAEAVNG